VNEAVILLSNNDHEADRDAVSAVVQEMVNQENLVVEIAEGNMPLVYKPTFFYSEQHLAKLIKQQLQQPKPVDPARVESWIERFTQSRGIELSQQQYEAVATAATAKVMILTGGPGCGKTFTTRTIVALWKAMGKKIALAAPTGRAAQRLGEMTRLGAKTIHRLLEFDPSTRGFKRDQDNPLPCDAVIVDEASMLDLFLAHSLLKAIPKDAQLLLVGDIDQLPSVGAGNVLRDVIDSAQVPVVRLTQVFRQAAQSLIIRAAHQINKGKFPYLELISDQPRADCLWHTGGTQPEHGVQAAGELITQFVPKLGFNPVTDVQVLCPMTRGAVGTRNFNQVLQNLLNPPHPEKLEITRGGTVLREKDRVIQLKNDYERGVFNGDLGNIVAIDPEEKEVTVAYPDNVATYDYADLNEIGLAWAVTIHKAQGSEYPVVVLPLYTQHYMMLFRNLLYTGITRAQKLVVVIGSKKALGIAVNQMRQQLRYTRLSERLKMVEVG
jgi:exodeoxyribonuclease V alpha subunit